MARHWMSIGYVSADSLWAFFDDYLAKISIQLEDKNDSELHRLFLAGKREAIDNVCTFLMEHETTMVELVERHGILTPEEIEAEGELEGEY